MKKTLKYFLLVVLVFSTNTLWAQKSINLDLDPIIKSYEGKNIKYAILRNEKENASIHDSLVFDKRGFLIGENGFMKSIRYSYDSIGKLVRFIRYSDFTENYVIDYLYVGDSVIVQTWTPLPHKRYAYDEKDLDTLNKNVFYYFLNENGFIKKEISEYHGYIVEYNYNSSNLITSKTYYPFNPSYNTTTSVMTMIEKYYYRNDKLTYYTKHNEQMNLVEVIIFSEAGLPMIKSVNGIDVDKLYYFDYNTFH